MKTFQLSIADAAALALNSTAPIFQIATPAALGLVILAIELTQINDETAQQLGIRLTRRSTASTLVTAAAAENLDRRNAAASGLTFSTTTNAYGVATVTGTRVAEIRLPSFDSRAGLYWEPAPERRIHIPPSAFYTLEFEAAPGATPTWVPAFYVGEE
jgi:hypothetical protein